MTRSNAERETLFILSLANEFYMWFEFLFWPDLRQMEITILQIFRVGYKGQRYALWT